MHSLLAAASGTVMAFVGAPAAATGSAASSGCQAWSATSVASGLGQLENLEFDRRGGLLLSATGQKAIVRLARGGQPQVLIANVTAPGGQRVGGNDLYFTTGNAAPAALIGTRDGTFDRFDLNSGTRTTLTTGLIAPNGLVFLPSGDAVVSRALGSGTGLTRVPAGDPARPQENWAALDGANGLAVDPTGTWVYAVETFTANSSVYRIRIADPTQIETVAQLGGLRVPRGLDDIDIDGAGRLYMAANGSGEILQLDPGSREVCVLATGFRNPSAVKFGHGAGWSPQHLFVTDFAGNVTELAPPKQPAASKTATPRRPPRACGPERSVRFAVPDPAGRERIVRVRARVRGGGRAQVQRKRGRFVVRVEVRSGRTAQLLVTAYTSRGHTLRFTRRYRACQ